VASNFSVLQQGREKQLLNNDVVHSWYRFVLAFPDHLVIDMCERFGATEKDVVLDPFCGTGTTLVECQKLGINTVGIEANPACVFASKVKTNWNIDPKILLEASRYIIEQASPANDILTFATLPLYAATYDPSGLKEELVANSLEARYFISSGMLQRGWLSETPFYKAIALLNEIKKIDTQADIKAVLKLALVAILVETIGNVRFGPEIYIAGKKEDADVLGAFRNKIEKIASDLGLVQANLGFKQSQVITGDARESSSLLSQNGIDHIDYVITSPPYPTEKDYTRQTRLELVFLGYVHDRKSLQQVKHAMVRSHSKGIYHSDCDGLLVKDMPEVQSIADELRVKVSTKTYGFAKLYPRIIEEYFGGMYRHLESLYHSLRSDGKCAYVVGDQRTYLQTYTPTGEILGLIAEKIGYEVEDILVWRIRKGTTGSGKEIKEEIVILRKP